MVKLKCPRKECGHVWEYKGDNKFKAPCSKCGTSVSIKKNEVKENE